MKTPMQEHIEWMQEKLRILVEYKDLSAGAEVDECIQHAESMLKKEKEVIVYAWNTAYHGDNCYDGEDYYNETFNSKEK
jgi:hypothetical protein